MPRIRWRIFTKGLWAMGARDNQPEGTLRRASGIAPVKTTALRSRWGSSVLFNRTAHSLYRFADARFAGDSVFFYRDGAQIHHGLNGGRLAFLKMPPTFQKDDFLFVAGGGTQFKSSMTGSTSTWGIYAPPDGFTATKVTGETVAIDRMELASTWTAVSATLADEGTIKQEGTQSMKMTVVAATTGTATKAITVDLTTYASGRTSPDQDFIECWVRVDNPANLEHLQLAFDVSSGGVADFSTDFYVRTVVASNAFAASGETNTQVLGVGDVPRITNNEPEFILVERFDNLESGGVQASIVPVPNPNFISRQEQIAIQEQLGQTTISVASGVWVKLRLPKSTFNRSGGGTGTFANVRAVQLVAKTNARGTVIVYWDDLKLAGGAGMQGRYRYRVTFKNSVTGHRSNPNSTTVEVLNVERQPVTLASLPVSLDAQVDQREIWRTVGGGVRFFLADRIANNTATSYEDRVADYIGLHDTATTFLQSVELPLDNDPPPASHRDTWGPHAGRGWWARISDTGLKGAIAFSPIGRPESVEDQLILTSDDDPTQKGVTWNGSNWVFVESGIFEIAGTGPFLARRVFGAPGTTEPLTVIPTPYGIAYLAHDGVRLFNGVQSSLVGFDALGLIFRGEGLDGLATFS